MPSFTHAIVRTPGPNFDQGLSRANAGRPDVALALRQHARYCETLRALGLTLIVLPADEGAPDGPFVEDTAVLAPEVAIITRPGAPERRGEVDSIARALARFYSHLHVIEPPGTVDGGDVCQVGSHFFIGLSARTNASGRQQLDCILRAHGYSCSTIDITSAPTLLHLKSGLSWIGGLSVLLSPELSADALRRYDCVHVEEQESYAANAINVNGTLLLADGYPKLVMVLGARGVRTLMLPMSEFRKMDGGLSCLSLRFHPGTGS